MLKGISLELFKCFRETEVPLAPLTVLTGPNASGKSTVMQALALLHQTIRENEWSSSIRLNGYCISLGTTSDVVDQVHGRNEFTIELIDEEGAYSWTFSGERDQLSMAISNFSKDGSADSTRPLRNLLPESVARSPVAQTLAALTYISAERLGPRDLYALEDLRVDSTVGSRGEFTANILYWRGSDPVTSSLLVDTAVKTLSAQVAHRMNAFFPGFGVEVNLAPRTNYLVLGIRTSSATDTFRPGNVGFGITQVLPIVVASLSIPTGGLLMIENPEVHLHPKAQSQMGEFLSEVAASGVQVLIETHSDHVLNGIRRSVRNKQIEPSSVNLHFFSRDVHGSTKIDSPILNSDGMLDHWPTGFFDQFDKDAIFLAGWED